MSGVTEGFRLTNGKHKGELITRVPASYLFWMVRVVHQHSGEAQAELDRRGTVIPQIEVSGHAIDRASQRLLVYWKESRVEEEGLHAWLSRLAWDAWQHGKTTAEDRRTHKGVTYVFEHSGAYPVLQSVFPARRK